MADKKDTIHIKKSHEGKFTNWCERKGYDGVTNSCIEEGLASKMANVRAMAQFASNAKKFKHN